MKSYDEIAKSVFERRDKYAAEQKRKKRIIISTSVPALCCCLVLIAGFGLWKNGVFGSNIPAADKLLSSPDSSPSDNKQNSVAGGGQSSAPPADNSSNNGSRENSAPECSTPSVPDKKSPAKPSDPASSAVTPSDSPDTDEGYFIDSVDKINFYSAKKIISEKSLLPISMKTIDFSAPVLRLLNNTYAEYPIDRSKVFNLTMVTYFTIVLNDEKGFLAQKLGGTGLAEVVVTENDIEDMGQMITFKREENYFTCFMNSKNNGSNSAAVSREFSSHKYIDGFNIVKNLEQENYKFTVRYSGSKVVGFECAPFNCTPEKYTADDATLIEDYCVVIYTKQTFTIDELEAYFKNNSKGKIL